MLCCRELSRAALHDPAVDLEKDLLTLWMIKFLMFESLFWFSSATYQLTAYSLLCCHCRIVYFILCNYSALLYLVNRFIFPACLYVSFQEPTVYSTWCSPVTALYFLYHTLWAVCQRDIQLLPAQWPVSYWSLTTGLSLYFEDTHKQTHTNHSWWSWFRSKRKCCHTERTQYHSVEPDGAHEEQIFFL